MESLNPSSASPPQAELKLKPVKIYGINLDLPGSERWKRVFEENQEACKESFDEMDKIINAMTGAITGGWLAKKTVEATIKLYVKLGKAWYLDELTFMANAIHVPIEKLIMCQLCYEMCAACSSIGIPVDGKMFHYRTMDWDFDFLRKITIGVEFFRGGELVFRGVTWIGYIGILTGVVPKSYSLSVNFRCSNGNILGNFFRATKMYYPIGYLCRDILESGCNIYTVKERLINSRLIAPCYFTLCQAYPAITNVFVRDPTSCVNQKQSFGYLIQTNRDDKKDPNNILWSKEREAKAEEILCDFMIRNQSGKSEVASISSIRQLLHESPIINVETIYVTIMVPETGEIETYFINK